MEKYEVMRQLPKVGERRLERRTLEGKNGAAFISRCGELEPCTVVEVNHAHLWYRVKFDSTGWCECYKLPKTEPLSWEVGQ
jgi:hypothetical protein